MNSPVQRLEALLQRVQENRHKPRALAPVAAPVAVASTVMSRDPRRDPEPMELEMEELPVTSPPPSPPATPPQAVAPRQPARAGSPLEMAVAGELGRPPLAPVPTPVGMPAPTPVGTPAPAPAPVAARAGAGNVETFSPEVPQPSKPIAQVVSKHAPIQQSTFGDLLRRSLSLRPR